MNPIQYSKEIKKIADELITESNILEILKPHGEVNLTGSYKYNLMYKPDIDMYIYNKSLSRKVFSNVAKSLLSLDYFDIFYFEDTYSSRREDIPGVPRGFYLRIDHAFKDKLFKFDIWLVRDRLQKESHYTQETKEIIDQLERGNFTEEQRETIVKLKHYKYENKPSLPPIRSFDIYKAVLKLGIIDPEEFVKWIKDQPKDRY